MTKHHEAVARIYEDYRTKYLRARAAADDRRREVHESLPEVKAIDRELELSGLAVMKASLDGGDVQEQINEMRLRNNELRRRRGLLMAAGGYPADYTEVRYECPLCNDSGYVDTKMCVCMRKQIIKAGYECSGMSRLLREQTFENFDLSYYPSDSVSDRLMRSIYAKMKKYAEEFNGSTHENLVLFGATGLGKTHLSSALAGVVIEKGYDVFYVSAISMVSDYESRRFGNSLGSESGSDIERYTACDLLILDDLGAEVTNSFTTTVLYDLINRRLIAGKPTLINTNLTRDDFRKRYWDRITSRIFGEYTILPFEGKDVRALKRKLPPR